MRYVMYVRNGQDEYIFYDSEFATTTDAIGSPQLKLELNKAGSLDFAIYPTHPLYNAFHKMTSYIRVEQDDEEIFRGRVLSVEDSTYLERKVQCEGDLAYLIDTIQPADNTSSATTLSTTPISNEDVVKAYNNVPSERRKFVGSIDNYGSGNDALTVYSVDTSDTSSGSSTIRQRLTNFITKHNSMIEPEKQFAVGNVTVDEPSSPPEFNSTNYRNTRDAIDEDLLKFYGGYIRTRKNGDVVYLDYLKDPGTDASQTIKMGVNLIDLQQKTDGGDLFTRLIPIGDDQLTIKTVNNGLDYIQKDSAYSRFGAIYRTESFSNVKDPNVLLQLARSYMDANCKEDSVSLTVKAIDMHLIDGAVEKIRIGQKVTVISDPHDLELSLYVTSIDYDIQNPENTSYEIGDPAETLSQKTNSDMNALASSADSANVKSSRASSRASSLATAVNRNASTIEDIAEKLYTLKARQIKIESDSLDINARVLDVETYQTTLKSTVIDIGADESITLNANQIKINGVSLFTPVEVEVGDGEVEVVSGMSIGNLVVSHDIVVQGDYLILENTAIRSDDGDYGSAFIDGLQIYGFDSIESKNFYIDDGTENGKDLADAVNGFGEVIVNAGSVTIPYTTFKGTNNGNIEFQVGDISTNNPEFTGSLKVGTKTTTGSTTTYTAGTTITNNTITTGTVSTGSLETNGITLNRTTSTIGDNGQPVTVPTSFSSLTMDMWGSNNGWYILGNQPGTLASTYKTFRHQHKISFAEEKNSNNQPTGKYILTLDETVSYDNAGQKATFNMASTSWYASVVDGVAASLANYHPAPRYYTENVQGHTENYVSYDSMQFTMLGGGVVTATMTAPVGTLTYTTDNANYNANNASGIIDNSGGQSRLRALIKIGNHILGRADFGGSYNVQVDNLTNTSGTSLMLVTPEGQSATAQYNVIQAQVRVTQKEETTSGSVIPYGTYALKSFEIPWTTKVTVSPDENNNTSNTNGVINFRVREGISSNSLTDAKVDGSSVTVELVRPRDIGDFDYAGVTQTAYVYAMVDGRVIATQTVNAKYTGATSQQGAAGVGIDSITVPSGYQMSVSLDNSQSATGAATATLPLDIDLSNGGMTNIFTSVSFSANGLVTLEASSNHSQTTETGITFDQNGAPRITVLGKLSGVAITKTTYVGTAITVDNADITYDSSGVPSVTAVVKSGTSIVKSKDFTGAATSINSVTIPTGQQMSVTIDNSQSATGAATANIPLHVSFDGGLPDMSSSVSFSANGLVTLEASSNHNQTTVTGITYDSNGAPRITVLGKLVNTTLAKTTFVGTATIVSSIAITNGTPTSYSVINGVIHAKANLTTTLSTNKTDTRDISVPIVASINSTNGITYDSNGKPTITVTADVPGVNNKHLYSETFTGTATTVSSVAITGGASVSYSKSSNVTYTTVNLTTTLSTGKTDARDISIPITGSVSSVVSLKTVSTSDSVFGSVKISSTASVGEVTLATNNTSVWYTRAKLYSSKPSTGLFYLRVYGTSDAEISDTDLEVKANRIHNDAKYLLTTITPSRKDEVSDAATAITATVVGNISDNADGSGGIKFHETTKNLGYLLQTQSSVLKNNQLTDKMTVTAMYRSVSAATGGTTYNSTVKTITLVPSSSTIAPGETATVNLRVGSSSTDYAKVEIKASGAQQVTGSWTNGVFSGTGTVDGKNNNKLRSVEFGDISASLQAEGAATLSVPFDVKYNSWNTEQNGFVQGGSTGLTGTLSKNVSVTVDGGGDISLPNTPSTVNFYINGTKVASKDVRATYTKESHSDAVWAQGVFDGAGKTKLGDIDLSGSITLDDDNPELPEIVIPYKIPYYSWSNNDWASSSADTGKHSNLRLSLSIANGTVKVGGVDVGTYSTVGASNGAAAFFLATDKTIRVGNKWVMNWVQNAPTPDNTYEANDPNGFESNTNYLGRGYKFLGIAANGTFYKIPIPQVSASGHNLAMAVVGSRQETFTKSSTNKRADGIFNWKGAACSVSIAVACGGESFSVDLTDAYTGSGVNPGTGGNNGGNNGGLTLTQVLDGLIVKAARSLGIHGKSVIVEYNGTTTEKEIQAWDPDVSPT